MFPYTFLAVVSQWPRGNASPCVCGAALPSFKKPRGECGDRLDELRLDLPGRRLHHAEAAAQFDRRDPLLGLCDEVHRTEPCRQRHLVRGEHVPTVCRGLPPAGVALVEPTWANDAVLCAATLRADEPRAARAVTRRSHDTVPPCRRGQRNWPPRGFSETGCGCAPSLISLIWRTFSVDVYGNIRA